MCQPDALLPHRPPSAPRLVRPSAAGSGTQCVIPYRGDDMEWRHLKVMGDLGVVTPFTFSPRDLDTMKRAIEGSDIVINLIGKVRAPRSVCAVLATCQYKRYGRVH